MPNRDKTGPEGQGPRTGRGAGPCTPTTEGQLNQQRAPQGRGRGGAGRGRGNGCRGRRNGPNGITFFS